jgi:hypothetical protein
MMLKKAEGFCVAAAVVMFVVSKEETSNLDWVTESLFRSGTRRYRLHNRLQALPPAIL